MKMLQIVSSRTDICCCNLKYQQSLKLCSRVGVSHFWFDVLIIMIISLNAEDISNHQSLISIWTKSKPPHLIGKISIVPTHNRSRCRDNLNFPLSEHLAMKLLHIVSPRKDICFCNFASQKSSTLFSKCDVYHCWFVELIDDNDASNKDTWNIVVFINTIIFIIIRVGD